MRPVRRPENGPTRGSLREGPQWEGPQCPRAGRVLEELGRRSAPADGWPGHLRSRAVAAAFPPRPDRINTGGPHQRGRSPGHSAGAVFRFHDGAHLLETVMGEIMMGFQADLARGPWWLRRMRPGTSIRPLRRRPSVVSWQLLPRKTRAGPRPPPRGPDGVTTRGLRFSPTPRRSPPVQPIPPTRPDASGVG